MNSGYKVLDNEFSKLLSMNFLLLGFGKVGFCEMLLNGEHYKRVDVRS